MEACLEELNCITSVALQTSGHTACLGHIFVLCAQECWFIGDVCGTFLWSNVLEYCENRVVYSSQNSLMIDR